MLVRDNPVAFVVMVADEPLEAPDDSCVVVAKLANGPIERVNRLARAYAQRAKLSLRETEVFTLFVSNGKSNKEIAADLGVAYPTVKLYWTRIYKKLGCDNAITALVDFLRASTSHCACALCEGDDA